MKIMGKLAGEYRVVLASNGDGRCLISVLVVDDGNGWSQYFQVHQRGVVILAGQNLQAAMRCFERPLT